ncbi:TPA: DUF4435 domain-containing protein [Serratia marcescens]|uniref:DUF4435 domain-containing protein n=1 Tax=Serratia marcescens SM39 TaxID=1334564 RepID=A0AAT9EXW4_SERMA|nr:DUF4435 domain-containing protein [Serratia marcescens]BAO34745.1 hypothetical protein SM39_2756 [Serratia marcescens SM39]BCZ42090.1 hypothetical protein SMGES_34160 [Serratia marcescens]HBI6266789.1 DUF4435 domain-containing protein [Serratia marcescens]HBI6951047.1 DUF4435 domain-containing protein [Serratia marcescens]HBI6958078.1 DUF4435 domain-containing protein [Serratia marcescens]
MSTNLLSVMKKEISSKNPLKQEILLKTSKFSKIFIFEGVDDYPVYDEWMKRNSVYVNAGHLVAKGKKQIIELYEHAIKYDDQEILKNCYFFVDHDFDTFEHNSDSIVTLSCYSIENYIINSHSAKSYLKDEFKMDITRSELLDSIKIDFESDFLQFKKLAKELCKPLFINHNVNGKAKFYDKISSVINLDYKDIRIKENAKLIGYEVNEDAEDVKALIVIFDNLTHERSIKGKYVFEFMKIWLSSLKSHLSTNKDLRITKDPLMLERRRLACATPIPKELMKFS